MDGWRTDIFAQGSGREGFLSSCCGSNGMRGSILRELTCTFGIVVPGVGGGGRVGGPAGESS